ncbi:hypothetical protein Leryth_008408 [Lithospermum erythrorhizon]|nr:hypothetical protein Leryth_008408 [Lithospermum erythrorhizon]
MESYEPKSGPVSNDLVDIFESSLHLEDTHYTEGYKEGYKDGLAPGKEEGREVGLKTGFEMGEELGFYRGCLDIWNSAIMLDQECFSSRVQKSIKQMHELLLKYPLSNPEDESGSDILDLMRLKFRAICASLNVKLVYIGYPKGSEEF